MAQDWDIKPRADACSRCRTPFADGQDCYSALVFGAEGYVRQDCCAGCRADLTAVAPPYSVWKGVFRMPPPPPEEPLKKETAESLLRKLIEDGEQSRAGVIYILAVMLERKRVLTEKDVQKRPDGVWIRVYEHRRTAETFLVRDPRLRLDELDTVQREVMELLGVGKASAPAAAGDSAAPPA